MASNSSALARPHDLFEVEAIILAVVNVIFSLFGIFGNVLVFIVLSRNRAVRSVSNMFIASLAIADLLACAVAQPMYAGFLFGLRRMPIYSQVRKVFSFVSLLASIGSLSAVTIDRYIAITLPMSYQLRVKVKNAAVLLVFIWLFSLGLGIPCGVFQTVQHISAYYTFAHILVILPLYLRIYLIARKQARAIARLTGHIRQDLSARTEGENIAAKTVGSVLAVFVICWLPLIVLPMIFRHSMNTRKIRRALKWSQTLALCSSAVNPVIYSLKTQLFKNELAKMYRNLVCLRSRKEKPECI